MRRTVNRPRPSIFQSTAALAASSCSSSKLHGSFSPLTRFARVPAESYNLKFRQCAESALSELPFGHNRNHTPHPRAAGVFAHPRGACAQPEERKRGYTTQRADGGYGCERIGEIVAGV